ncbi:hypothetical protein CJ191_08600, partial [Aerococcus viridans]
FILGFHGLFVYPKIVLAEIPKNFPPTLFIIEPNLLQKNEDTKDKMNKSLEGISKESVKKI